MPSGEFQRIVRDLAVLGDTCECGCSEAGPAGGLDVGESTVLRAAQRILQRLVAR